MQHEKNRAFNRSILIVLIVMIFQLTLLGSCVSADSDVVLIRDTDELGGYSRQVSSGESTTYNWTLRNEDPYDAIYNVTIDISSSNSDWTTSVVPDALFTIQPTDYQMVTLTVTAPSNKNEGKTNVTLIFTIIGPNGSKIQEEERHALTSLTPLVTAEEKKIMDMFENPLPAPLDNEFGVFLLTVLVWFGISILLILIMDPCVKALTKKTKTQVDDIILRIIRTPLLVLVFFYGVVSSLRILDEHIPEVAINAINSLYSVVAVLIIFYVAYKLFKDILVYYGELIAAKTSSNIDNVVIPIVEKIGVMIIGLMALGYVLGYMNIDLTMFVAGGVVISMVIAFAAQETLSNFFSGIFILTDRPFVEGDTIILPDGDWNEVRNIGLRSTRLFRYKDASLISIPNNMLAGDKITNYSNPYDKVRIRKTIGVAYGTDAEKTKKIIREIVSNHPNIINDNEDLNPIIRFDSLGESSIDFFIQVHVDDRSNKMTVVDYLNTEIYKRFNEEGIEIPFPQRVIHMKKE